MSKSKIIITILVATSIIAGIVVMQQLAKRSISVQLSNTDFSVVLYEGFVHDDKQIARFDANTTLSLKDGYYCAVVAGERYSVDEQCFVVYKQDKTVEINPEYSAEYLASLLTDSEIQLITRALEAVYPQVLTGFTYTNGALVADGTWYVGVLTQNTAHPSEQGDIYRFILRKVDGTWQIAAKPQLVISSPEFPDVPKAIVQAANNL